MMHFACDRHFSRRVQSHIEGKKQGLQKSLHEIEPTTIASKLPAQHGTSMYIYTYIYTYNSFLSQGILNLHVFFLMFFFASVPPNNSPPIEP